MGGEGRFRKVIITTYPESVSCVRWDCGVKNTHRGTGGGRELECSTSVAPRQNIYYT